MATKKKKLNRGYRTSGTKSVCVRLTPEQHQYVKKASVGFGERGVSEYIRQLIERDQRINQFHN